MEEIGVNDFHAVAMHAGTVLDAQIAEGTHHPALRLWIDFGPLGVRQSSAQITRRYEAQTLIGQQVIAVLNLPSIRVGGFKSECLVLGLVPEPGDVVLIQAKDVVPNGTKVA